MFRIGECISYPMHGIGRIDGIEEREVRGVVGMYYVLCFRADGLRVLLPLERTAEVNLRRLADADSAERVLEYLSSPFEDEEFANWNRRYRANMDKLKSGGIDEIATVVKSLAARAAARGLSSGEKAMLANARGFLVDELSAILKTDLDEMSRIVENALCGIVPADDSEAATAAT